MRIGALERERTRAAHRGLDARWLRRRHARCVHAPILHEHLGNVRIHRTQVRESAHGHRSEAQHRLGKTRGARCGLRVAHARLDGLKHQRAIGRTASHEHRRRRTNLDRVAERRTGTMHLERQHVRTRDTSVTGRAQHHRLLRRAVRGSQRARAAVLVHGGATEEHG